MQMSISHSIHVLFCALAITDHMPPPLSFFLSFFVVILCCILVGKLELLHSQESIKSLWIAQSYDLYKIDKKIKELSKFWVKHPQKNRKKLYRVCLFSDDWNLMQKCFLGCMWLLGMAVDWFNEDNSNSTTSLVPSQRFFPPFPH